MHSKVIFEFWRWRLHNYLKGNGFLRAGTLRRENVLGGGLGLSFGLSLRHDGGLLGLSCCKGFRGRIRGAHRNSWRCGSGFHALDGGLALALRERSDSSGPLGDFAGTILAAAESIAHGEIYVLISFLRSICDVLLCVGTNVWYLCWTSWRINLTFGRKIDLEDC